MAFRPIERSTGLFKSAAFRDGSAVARAMNDTHNHDGVGKRPVIDGVWGMERDAQAGRQPFACGAREREVTKWFEMRLQDRQETRRGRFGTLGGYRRPDLGEIVFRRLG